MTHLFTTYPPGQNVHDDRDADVGRDHVDPHLKGERREEGEKRGCYFLGFLVEDGDTQVHEGHGEIYRLFPLIGDGEVCHGHIHLLLDSKNSEDYK